MHFLKIILLIFLFPVIGICQKRDLLIDVSTNDISGLLKLNKNIILPNNGVLPSNYTNPYFGAIPLEINFREAFILNNKKTVSVSLNIPLQIGASYLHDPISSSNDVHWRGWFALPLMINLNTGLGASNQSFKNKKNGFYIGIGGSLNKIIASTQTFTYQDPQLGTQSFQYKYNMFTTINTIIGYRFKGRKSGKFKTIYFGMNFGQNGTNMWTVGTGSCAH